MVFPFSIRKKLVVAFLALSMLPLSVLGISILYSLRAIGRHAIDSSTHQLETRARESLELRAVELADRVHRFLLSCEADVLTLRMLPLTPEVFQQFGRHHQGEIWTREGTNEAPVEVRRKIPLYRELAFIGADGIERIRIADDAVVPPHAMRDVSRPENTTYRSERYFEEALKLKEGEIFVSRLTGWYVKREEQLQGARDVESAVEGRKYEGVIRFATPRFHEDGTLEGIVLLSLDHRHLMELTLHILPTEARFVVFPSYSSGNYAFMFDDEGWIISHPKFYDIRGLRPDGSGFDPHAPDYTRERLLAGEVPFNLDFVSFINPNYPLIAREVRQGRSGVTSTFNVGGIPRVMAYAAIPYYRPPYDRHNVFGGITIGVETLKFQEPALMVGSKIDEMVRRTKASSLLILGFASLAAMMLAAWLARSFTRPILSLARQAEAIAAGGDPETVSVKTGDELELLAGNFADMAREIREHQKDMEDSLQQLAGSKKSLEKYSLELEKQLRVLQNVHYLSQYLSSVYDREQVLETVLKTCVDGLGYDRAILYLYDPLSRRLVCHHTYGFTPLHDQLARTASYDIEADDCIPTRVFRTGETMFVKDIHHEEYATPLDLKIAEVGELDFFVFAPIKSRDRIIGVMGADTKISRREIHSTDVESLQILANDAARAIERSELYWRLVNERNFIKSIVTHMTSGIVTLDDGGRVTWFNPYSEKVFHISAVVALKRPYSEVFAAFPSWVEVIRGYLEAAPDKVHSLEHHSVFQEGREKILEVHFSTIHQEKQNKRVYLLFIRDVTQRKRMEEHIRRSDRLVSLGVLAAGIAHEMRNPLTGISLLLDDLHDRLDEMPRERELIQRSLHEMDRLENLINGLLEFAMPSRGVKLQVRPLMDVVDKTLFLVRKMCRNQKISLSIRGEEPLPLLQLDPEKLQQALLNLLLNSIQAMPDGGSLSVEVKTVSTEESLTPGPAVRVSVVDSGKGIAAEDIPYIFDPFFSRNPSGCGLGLAIVHSIVEEHRGHISVTSRPGEGTTFWIDLPVSEGSLAPEESLHSEPRPA